MCIRDRLKEDEIASKQGAKPLDSIDMDLDESAIEKERKHLLSPNEMVERPVEISVSHLAVSYTHLDVYKRQYELFVL